MNLSKEFFESVGEFVTFIEDRFSLRQETIGHIYGWKEYDSIDWYNTTRFGLIADKPHVVAEHDDYYCGSSYGMVTHEYPLDLLICSQEDFPSELEKERAVFAKHKAEVEKLAAEKAMRGALEAKRLAAEEAKAEEAKERELYKTLKEKYG